MRKALVFGYGLFSYLFTLAAFFFFAGWLINLPLPLTIDGGEPPSALQAFVVNTLLMVAYFTYHSVFARTSVKKKLRRVLPKNLERVTYNLVSSILLFAFCWAWQPIPGLVWEITATAGVWIMYGLFLFFVVLHYVSIFMINHNDFFGLRQAWLEANGKSYEPLPAVSERYYMVSHVLLAFSLAMIPWFIPAMSLGHLYLAILWTGYMALGAWLSHRDPGDVKVTAASEEEEAPALVSSAPA